MKKRKLILILFLLISISGMSQGRGTTCNLNDSDFIHFIKIRRYDIPFVLGKAALRDSDNIFLDSLANFILLHPQYIIEIGVHSDYVPPAQENHLSMYRAMSIGDYLHSKGVPFKNYVQKGYSGTSPLYTEKQIATAKTKKEKDSLRYLNRRVEFRIIGILPPYEKTFALTDFVFIGGSILRNYDYSGNDLTQGSEMRPEKRLFLDSIVTFLKAHPTITLEVGVHTDTRGSSESSWNFSVQRANEICNYIISKGIPKERVIPRPYGSLYPYYWDYEIAKAPTKEEQESLHQKNNRVEFQIFF
jgi:outer membrane protein OmpA-like peptidoglycan-associated protein